jgi:hypothetical protein
MGKEKDTQAGAGQAPPSQAAPGDDNQKEGAKPDETTVGPVSAEMKQGVVTAGDTASSKPKRWKVAGFSGSYKNVNFNDAGESDGPVSDDVAAEFRKQYPGAQITEIE